MAKTTRIKKIEKILGVEFKDESLIDTAFIHRSFLNENGHRVEHNERLEYLGDAVLEFLVSKHLYKNYPNYQEGELTSFRAAIVRTQTLAATAREMNFGEFLLMSKGEEQTGGREKEYLLANTFEAVLGAIYLDRGVRVCESYLKRVLFPIIPAIVQHRLDIDPKTKFQEIAQETYKATPTYETVSESGPDHNKTFEMAVYVGNKKFGIGKGSSKQRAEEEAAKVAIKKIKEILKQRKSSTTA